MLGQCEAQGLPCVAAHAGTAAGDFRDNVAAFRQMGAIKVGWAARRGLPSPQGRRHPGSTATRLTVVRG